MGDYFLIETRLKNDRYKPVSYTHLDVYKRQDVFYAGDRLTTEEYEELMKLLDE